MIRAEPNRLDGSKLLECLGFIVLCLAASNDLQAQESSAASALVGDTRLCGPDWQAGDNYRWLHAAELSFEKITINRMANLIDQRTPTGVSIDRLILSPLRLTSSSPAPLAWIVDTSIASGCDQATTREGRIDAPASLEEGRFRNNKEALSCLLTGTLLDPTIRVVGSMSEHAGGGNSRENWWIDDEWLVSGRSRFLTSGTDFDEWPGEVMAGRPLRLSFDEKQTQTLGIWSYFHADDDDTDDQHLRHHIRAMPLDALTLRMRFNY